jgi:hypothetical protein
MPMMAYLRWTIIGCCFDNRKKGDVRFAMNPHRRERIRHTTIVTRKNADVKAIGAFLQSHFLGHRAHGRSVHKGTPPRRKGRR